jgi:hypothetical protein
VLEEPAQIKPPPVRNPAAIRTDTASQQEFSQQHPIAVVPV